MDIAQKCMQIFGDRDLSNIGLIEQDIACGTTSDGQPAKLALDDAIPIWANHEIGSEDRLRLFLIYLVHTCGLRQDDMKLLMEHCRVDSADLEILANMEQFGVPVYKQRGKGRDRQT